MAAGPPQMPPGLQAKADAQIGVFWPEIEADETAYFAAHGIHWQGLATHSEPPENGADVLPDVGDRTPHDQPVPWPASLIASPLTITTTVDVYEGPQGHGYVITAVCQTTPPQVPTEAASKFSRTFATGPDAAALTHDWAPVPPPLDLGA